MVAAVAQVQTTALLIYQGTTAALHQLKGQLPRTGSTAEHLTCCLSDLLVPSERDYTIPTYSFERWVTARTQE